MRRKLPVFILAIVFLLQAFVPAVYVASENETISSNIYLCPFDAPPEGAGKVMSPSAAANKIVNAERVGSGLKGDIYHRAASYLSESQISKGTVYDLGKNNTLLQVEGSANGKTGIFEYILNENGQVTHQLFKEGGIINGIPN